MTDSTTTRTHGTYRWVDAAEPGERPRWSLELEPAVRMRARRTFGRTQQTRTMAIELFDTKEVCRDLTWFMQRFPLEPADDESRERLQAGTAAHESQERTIQEVLAGRGTVFLDDPDIKHTPQKEPREYQVIANQLLRARGRLLLADPVGLGKTYTALLNAVNKDALPMLVVPPTHLPPRWVTEITEAFPWLSYMVAKKTQPPASIVAGHFPDVIIVPYSKLDGWAGYLQGSMAYVVFDEVQELRHGLATEKGKAAALVCEPANFAVGLTATPVHNYGGEVWNILDILAPGELGSREEFKREWGAGTAATSGEIIVEDPHALGSYLKEQGLVLSRSRASVGKELPGTIKVHQLVDTDHAALDDVRASVEELAKKILATSTSNQERFQAAGEIDWKMRRATGIDKAPFVADWVRMLLESEERVVLWGWHRDVYDIWMERLADFNPMLYTGTESPKQKADAERRFTAPLEFENDPLACRVLIMSLRSGAGVDGLQKVCRVGVFGELDWTNAVHEQAIGRLARDGMGNDPAVAYYLTSPEGSDPKMLEVLQVKRQQAEPLLSDDGNLLQGNAQGFNRGRALAQQILGVTEPQEAIA